VNLAGASVLLTGASGGIGEAIARSLAARGATLMLTGRRADALRRVAAETGGRPFVCDLANRSDVERLVDEAMGVDVLVNNAAIPAGGDILGFDADALDFALDVNLRAPMILARRLADPMLERGHGHLVFVNSMSGKAASPGSAVYSATKFGLRGFALGLREDLRPHGVGVSTVFPGFISDAGMFARSGAKLPSYVRTRTPQQVADAVVRAIEGNHAERAVAPLPMRLGAAFAGLAPELTARVQHRLGAADVSRRITEGQARALAEREAEDRARGGRDDDTAATPRPL
jgi:short-subunit dehydrogenase